MDTTEAPALPGDGLREGIVDELRRHIGDGLVEYLLKPQDDLWIRVRADVWEATGRALRAMGFEYFTFLSAIDWMPSPYGRGEDDPTEPPPERSTEIEQGYAGGETRFQVLARVADLRRHVGVTLKVDVAGPDEGAEVFALDSWHAVYAGANWHERETREMFGIGFNGHPDLRNLYLPGDFEGYPLRKDFPLLARMIKPWPGIVDVEPMPAEDQPDETADATTETAATTETTATTETADDAPDPQPAPEPSVAGATTTDTTTGDTTTGDTTTDGAADEEGSARPEALERSDLATDTASTDPATDAVPDVAADEQQADEQQAEDGGS